MVPIDQFWDTGDYENPPLTDAMLAAAEAQLGVTLPDEYVQLLRIRNGGYPRGLAFPTSQPTSWADDHVPLHELYGIVTDPEVESGLNVLETEYMTREWDLPPRQVLLSGDGHTWITLDYRNGPVPSVAWIDAGRAELIELAPTFAAFLAGLVPDSQFIDDDELDDDELDQDQAH